ncbi:MAG: hypothetical protein RLZZ383_466 [Pseudomonadota bacterium]|jgi:hypothetical protein
MLVVLAWLSFAWAQGVEGGGLGAHGAPDDAPPIGAVTPTETAMWAAWRPGDLVVTDPGDPASAALLRYAFAPGDRHTFRLTGSMTMTMTMMGLSPTVVEVPDWQADGWIRVDAVKDGVATASVRFTGFVLNGDVEPEMRETFRAVGKQVRKYRGESDIDDRGRTLARRDNSADVFDENTRQLMDLGAMLFQLPEAPVGRGAVWHTGALKASSAAANLQLETLSTFTLTAHDGERATIDLASQIRLADGSAGAVPMPGMEGMNLRFERVAGEGSGKIEIDLSSPLPIHSEANERSEVAISSDGGPFPLNMTQTMDMHMVLTSDAP